jgi:diguanylate cyclase (GGDEF)-like protein/PAS domain S-box-containing protein
MRLLPAARRLLLIIWPFLVIEALQVFLAVGSVNILSAGRAYVNGESLWSKAHKDAVASLIAYARTHDKEEFLRFKTEIAVPLGDQRARLELNKPQPDYDVVVRGFLQGRNHPDDMAGLIFLYRHFGHLAYMREVIGYWAQADEYIWQLAQEADGLNAYIQSGGVQPQELERRVARIEEISRHIPPLNTAFSYTLGEATRWTQAVLLGANIAFALTFVPLGVFFSYRMVKRSKGFEDKLARSEERFQLAVRGTNDGLWDWGMRTREVYYSPRYKQLLGYEDSELENTTAAFVSCLHPDDRRPTLLALRSHLRSDSAYDVECRLKTKSGEYRWFRMRGQAVRDESGRPIRMAGSISDITDRKLAESAVFAEKERAQVTLQSIGDAVITTDTEGHVDYLNPVAEKLTGWTMAEAQGRPLHLLFRLLDEPTQKPALDPVEAVVREGHAVEGPANLLLMRGDGTAIPVDESAAPIRDRSERICGVVLVFHDVSRERQFAAKLSYQASHDALTGLINRREFEIRLSRALDSAAELRRQHAVMYLDLDQFKVVNDTCGHAAGDQLMQEVSRMLRRRLRESDTLARLGGDEFGVLLENCSPEHAGTIAEALRQTVADLVFAWHTRSFSISASIGLVNVCDGTFTLAEVMSAADAACYMAKEKGRNRLQTYSASDSELTHRHGEMEWAARIPRALDEGRFLLYAQEIMDLNGPTRKGAHVELLVRMVDEHGRLVPPMAFIPAAERYNLMPAIDRWVIRTAFSTLAAMQAAGRQDVPDTCAINLSGSSIGDERFLEFVREQFAQYPIPHNAVCFEITETAVIGSMDKAVRFIEELRAFGCSFALDDFGAGMSSFAYLKRLPVDLVKIDGAFVKEMANDATDRAMVEAINHIGQMMGKRTIAEFVENDRTLALLRDIGVDFAQGYGIAKPVPFQVWDLATSADPTPSLPVPKEQRPVNA